MILEDTSDFPLLPAPQPLQPSPVCTRTRPPEAPERQSRVAFSLALTELDSGFWRQQRECSPFPFEPTCGHWGTTHACIQKSVGYWPYSFLQKPKNVWISSMGATSSSPFFTSKMVLHVMLTDELDNASLLLYQDVVSQVIECYSYRLKTLLWAPKY